MNKDFGLEVNRPFYIRSKLPMQRFLECQGAYHLRLRTLKRSAVQQWVFDGRTKTIMSKQWRNRSLNAQSNGHMIAQATNARWMQLWRFENNMLRNERGTVLQVQSDTYNSQFYHKRKSGNMYQQFDIIYADELPPDLKKGDFNEQFGIHIERPFFVVSAL